MVMAEHPHDVVEAILLLLPVKSLMRFKCVGKSWCALIRNRYFAEQHSALRPAATHLLIIDSECEPTILAASLHGGATSDHTLPNILEHGSYFNLPSCCDGLISMHPFGKANTLVYNPNTRETLSIPFNANAFEDCISVRTFIGFEPVSNQYKLMLLGRLHRYDPGSVHCEIITLGGSKDWRQVIINGTETSCLLLLGHGPSTCFNGALHWLTNSHTQPIAVFDLESEKFGVIPGPKRIQESKRIVFDLCHVGGRLTLTEWGKYALEASLELWTLKDYYNGVWVKQTLYVSVPLSPEYIGMHLCVIGGMNNDEILICIGLEPFAYDMKTKKCSKINVGEHEPTHHEDIVLCTESMRYY